MDERVSSSQEDALERRPLKSKRSEKPAKKSSLGLVWLWAFLNEGSKTFLNSAASAREAGYRGKSPHVFEQIGFANKQRFKPKIAEWLDQHGFSETRLKIKLLSLLQAKETVWQKVKGAVCQKDLPPGYRVIATSGTVITMKDGKVYGYGETLLEIEVVALETQRRSLELALSVKGMFGAEKVEHSGSVGTKLELTDEDRVLLRQLVDASIKKLKEAERANPA
jgi:hypothetical protein